MTDYAYLFRKQEQKNESASETLFTAILMIAMLVVLSTIIIMLPNAIQ